MHVELPPFKNGEYNSESAFTIDRVTTPLILSVYIAIQSVNFMITCKCASNWR